MKHSLYFASLLFLFSCGFGVKEKVNKIGQATGETAGEFIDGASKGVENAFDVKISIDTMLLKKGIEIGKTTFTSDNEGSDNVAALYIIFNSDFSGTLTTKVFDAKGKEMGRRTEEVIGKKNEARFVEFHFDKHTNIDSDSKITVE